MFFIVNDKPGALFELNLNPDGTQDGPTVPRQIVGLAAGAQSDPEGIARIDTDGAIDLIVASSLSIDSVGASGMVSVYDGVVRVRYAPDGGSARAGHAGILRLAAGRLPRTGSRRATPPNDNGLNIEGLAWDPSRRALLFGARSPVTAGSPADRSDIADSRSLISLRHKVLDNIDYDAAWQEFLVIVGRSISGGNPPFQLCTWDGTASTMSVLP